MVWLEHERTWKEQDERTHKGGIWRRVKVLDLSEGAQIVKILKSHVTIYQRDSW